MRAFRERDFSAGTGFGNGDGIWERERDLETGAGESEQRYSGKPDGFAGTPKNMSTDYRHRPQLLMSYSGCET